MSGSSPKRKGDGYERELAKYFNEKVFGGDDLVQRMPLSGGGAIKSVSYTHLTLPTILLV